MRCPACNLELAFDKRVFGYDFRCRRCGARLLVSGTYGRSIMLISMVLGFSMPWVMHLHSVLIPTLGPLAGFTAVLASGFLFAFAVLFLIVRLAPRLISPRLVLQRNSSITYLNLTAEREE